MDYMFSAHTDIGSTKQANQDSLLVMEANTADGKALFAVACDGMGGLSKGELASAALVGAFSGWFQTVFPQLAAEGLSAGALQSSWFDLLNGQNNRIHEYGSAHGINMGTTVVALLLYKNQYYIVNVGDSRVYQIQEAILQLTKDQTFVQREVDRGNMTLQQAHADERRNILLQCVGASASLEPDFFTGPSLPQTVYMLCTDGFCHTVENEEWLPVLRPQSVPSEASMHVALVNFVELCMQRNERDNISAVLVKTI
ncbi:MAG: PP2C family protein-serine/threonine phosphatase [Oscillospiraceae bacterium]